MARRWLRAALLCASIALASALLAGSAQADGDPASDVLVSQNVFLPWDAGATTSQQARLQAVLQAANRNGYPIRVAVIASRSDLGSVTALWRQPEAYAQFLGEELSLVFGGRVLIVMSDGFGLYGGGHPRPAEQAALTRVRSSAGSAQLPAVAVTAVEELAAASGHPLALGGVQSSPPAAGSGSGSGSALSWVVFVVGAAVIAAAWTSSLRARPLRLRNRASSG